MGMRGRVEGGVEDVERFWLGGRRRNGRGEARGGGRGGD